MQDIKICYHHDASSTAEALCSEQELLEQLQQFKFGDDDGGYIEVPPEQYQAIMASLQEKIKLGKFKNASGKPIKNPNEALKRLKPGKLSFKQVQNIAKAGNLDSITFDVKSNALRCSCALGASLAIGIALSLWRGQSLGDALKTNVKSSLNSSLSSMAISVTTSQVLRTALSQVGTKSTNQLMGALYQNNVGKNGIEQLAKFSTGSALPGSQAVGHVANMVRSNIIASIVTTTVLTAPDFYRAAFKKSISWQQFSKNLTINSVSIAGGSVGWMVGAAAGASVGSALPLVGTAIGGIAGGLIGAFGAGTIFGKATKSLADKVRADDAQLMLKLCEQVGIQLCQDYLLSTTEAQELIAKMSAHINPKFLQKLYQSARKDNERLKWCYEYCEPWAQQIVHKRPSLIFPDDLSLADIHTLSLESEAGAASNQA